METEARDEKHRAYAEAIRRRVCGVCLDSRIDGSCSVIGRVCAIEAYLPEVVCAILATRSQRMVEYVDAIRAQVCSPCIHEDDRRRCTLRNEGDCALDTHLPLVVDAIEAVEGSVPAAGIA